jgi:type II secretory pathway pseudopilin PulG
MMILKKIKSQKGFTLIEIIIYLFITTMLLLIISSMVLSIFNARKQLQASHAVNHNARFIINFLSNRVHNVDLISDVSPAPEEWHFYQMPDIRFSIDVEGDDLIYRQVQDTGAGFPDQSTALPLALNANRVVVSNLAISSISDAHANLNKGVKIDFILTVGSSSGAHGYVQKSFSTFLSIR